MSKSYELTTTGKEISCELPTIIDNNKLPIKGISNEISLTKSNESPSIILNENILNGNNLTFIDADELDTNDAGILSLSPDTKTKNTINPENSVNNHRNNNVKKWKTNENIVVHNKYDQQCPANEFNSHNDRIQQTNIVDTVVDNGNADQTLQMDFDKNEIEKINRLPCHNSSTCTYHEKWRKLENCLNKCCNELCNNGGTVNKNSAKLKIPSLIFNNDDDTDDPYSELEIYLDKVKQEINDVFEQFKLSDGLHRSVVIDNSSNKLLFERRNTTTVNSALSDSKVNKIGSRRNSSSNNNNNNSNTNQQNVQQNEKIIKTAEWANTILKDLDNLMQSDKKRRTLAKNDADNSNVHNNNEGNNVHVHHVLEKNAANCNNHNNFMKPEKHSCIALQSFHLKKPLNGENNSKSPITTIASSSACDYQFSKLDNETVAILKIEENTATKNELSQSKTTSSTQTNFIDLKKGSTSTIWTSEESILRSTVDDDNKSSSSSSACDVASGVLSSGKSGNSLDSSGLDNDNNESGIGTATPPKDQDIWHGQRKCLDTLLLQNFGNTTWVRTENVTTQTTPTIEPQFVRYSRHKDDPDLLEVLSLCEEVANEYEIVNVDWNGGDAQIKQFDTTFCTDSSSCSTKSSCENPPDCDISIQNHRNYSPQSLNSIERNYHSVSSAYRQHHHHRSNEKFGRKNSKSESESVQFCDKEKNDYYSCSNREKSMMMNDRRIFCLQLQQEPYDNIIELPSPSSASLNNGIESIIMNNLSEKSNSAPILLKNERNKDELIGQIVNLRYSRSQSDRYLAEIEAIEACKWLRAAGFPQYAQMYEDMQFPIDLSNVAKDHPFLENDPLQSLYRRLVALNRCATMRLDSAHKQHANKEDSEEDEYALSDNWTFEQKNRRWSRVDEIDIPKNIFDKSDKNLTVPSGDSSPERDDSMIADVGFTTIPSMSVSQYGENGQMPIRFRRSGSERLKDGAKAFLRRVESIKSRRRKRQNRDAILISEPQALNLTQINQKMNDLKYVEHVVTMSTPPSPIPSSPYTKEPTLKYMPLNNNDLKVLSEYSKYNPNRLSPKHITTNTPKIYQQSHSSRTSPLHFCTNNPSIVIEVKSGDESSSYYSDASQDSSGGGGGGGNVVIGGIGGSGGSVGTSDSKKRPTRTKRFLQKGSSKVEDIGAVSDSECHHFEYVQHKYFTNNNSELLPPKLSRGGSLNLGKESNRYRDAFKSKSFRSRSSSHRKETSDKDSTERSTSSVVRWHSFQSAERPDYIFKKCFSNRPVESEGTPLAAMSCGQLQVIRKLALVTLTGYMERYCPTHRSGWNWELPKFIKKIKAPDYKDKKVFGVPFLLLLQRTGETLPKSIQTALKWLKLNAMDQIGIFRKSGVKSRILKLKLCVEESPLESMSLYDIQQAYDVADMVKQYFRELPDLLLTAKMSETFMAIFQHLPVEVRADAVQCAVLLLPDEHREVLQHLLEFLHNVAENSDYNQMTAHNLAVCLAPSLFHGVMSSVRTNAASPRRRKATGVPDPRELSETKASHECLTYLIENCRSVFTVSSEKITRCNFGYMEESRPVPLEALGEGLQVHDWRGYLYECVSATIKEGRERSRGWVSSSSLDNHIEIAYKKVGDGHPLKLWRCTTEVDAPPTDVLHYIFKERHNWDQHLLKWRIIEQLDEKSQIYQYAIGAQAVTDFCVLRSWRSDLPRGACVIVETSVEHAKATLLMGGVRGVVLASRYLIEPSGNGKSKIMHLARVDIKGKTPEWYNKTYGHICSHHLTRIRNAFKQIADGPESKI